jgi:hypothetical protein
MAMTLKELEDEVVRLKEQVAEHARLKDYIEIWKLQSLYVHLYTMCMRDEIIDLFARKTPGVSIEMEDGGVYEGIEGVKKVFGGILSEKNSKVPGFLGIHMTVNPLIEINKAGTRARGVWPSHGSCALRIEGKLTAYWCLGKYDMEYVKEDGKWKFLKLVYRQIYMTPYEKGWIEEPQGASIACFPEYPPDKPCTHHLPYNRYRINIFQPPPPEPYND